MASSPSRTSSPSHKSLAYETVAPLLGKKVTVAYRKAREGSLSKIDLTVGEVYARCQKKLSEELGKEVRLVIKGSSVAHLFSGEPCEDIDIHCVADLVHIADSEKIRKGHELKWTILRAIAGIIQEKDPAAGVITSESLVAEESLNLLYSRERKAPFNVFNIRLGEIPLEFSLFCMMEAAASSPRSFDFNSGALDLSITEEGFVLRSALEDIDAVIEGISKRELYTTSPEMITRKGVCRYLAKILISGYSDKNAELFEALLQAAKSAKPGQTDEAAALFIFKEITDHFIEKKIDPQVAYLSLWLMKTETGIQKALSKMAKEALASSATLPSPLRALVEKGKKSESCWQLLMLARHCKKVVHRGEECLQLEIEHSTLFPGAQVGRGIYLTLPIAGLKKFAEITDTEFFLHAYRHPTPIGAIDAPTKVALQELFKETLTSFSLYPALALVLQKFSLEPTKEFTVAFFDWYSKLSEEERSALPFSIIKRNLPYLTEDISLKPGVVISLIRSFAVQVGPDQLVDFEEPLKSKPITSFVLHFLRSDKFDKLPEEDKRVLIACAAARSKELLAKAGEDLKAYVSQDSGMLSKLTLSLIQALYIRHELEPENALLGARLALEMGYTHHAMKSLETIFTTEKKPLSRTSQGQLLEIAKANPLGFYEILKNHSDAIKGIIDIHPFLSSLLFNASKETAPDELRMLFIDILSLYGSEAQKIAARIELFRKQAHGDAGAEKLLHLMRQKENLTVLSFPWVKEMDDKELSLLTREKEYEEQRKTNRAFTEAVTQRALELGMYDRAIEGALVLTPSTVVTPLAVLTSYLRAERSTKEELCESIKLINGLVEHHPELLSDASFKDLIEKRLTALSSYLASIGEGGEFDDVLARHLCKLHRLALLKTLDHPLWPVIWKRFIHAKNVEEWIDPSTFKDQCKFLVAAKDSPLDSSPHALAFIMMMSQSPTLAISMIHSIGQFARGNGDAYAPLTLKILHGCWTAIYDNPPKPSLEAQEAAAYVFRLFCEHPHTGSASSPLQELFFCASCGDSRLRKLVMEQLFHPMRPAYRVAEEVRDAPIPEHIFFACVDRAIEEENIEELLALKEHFSELTPCKLERGETLVAKIALPRESDFIKRCSAWQELLNKLFKDNPTVEPAEGASQRIKIFNFYTDYIISTLVAENLKNAASGVPSTSENLRALRPLMALLDFIAKKKSLHMIDSIGLVVNTMKSFPPEIASTLATKHFQLAIGILQTMQKKEPSAEHRRIFDHLMNYTVLAINSCEGAVDQRLLKLLLELARPIYVQCEHLEIPGPGEGLDSARAFHSLEAYFDREATESYYLDWMRNIVERKETVLFEELSLFAQLTFRLDLKYLDKIAGADVKRFSKIAILSNEWFEKPLYSKLYIEIFEILFSRFAAMLPPASSVVHINPHDPFSLFYAYRRSVESSIRHLKNHADRDKLDTQYLEAIAPLLNPALPKHNMMCEAVRIVLGRILRTDKSGNFELRERHKEASRGRGPSKENLLLFYYSVINIPSLHKNYFLELRAISYLKLQALFCRLKPELSKVLTADQINEMSRSFKTILFLEKIYMAEKDAAKATPSDHAASGAGEDAVLAEVLGMFFHFSEFADISIYRRREGEAAFVEEASVRRAKSAILEGVTVHPDHRTVEFDLSVSAPEEDD